MAISLPLTQPRPNNALVLAFGASDASVTVPPQSASLTSGGSVDNNHLRIFKVIVSGGSCYINYGAVATSADACLPDGYEDTWQIPSGTVVHALQNSGAGILSLIPAPICG